jgi:hypothetical protein
MKRGLRIDFRSRTSFLIRQDLHEFLISRRPVFAKATPRQAPHRLTLTISPADTSPLSYSAVSSRRGNTVNRYTLKLSKALLTCEFYD